MYDAFISYRHCELDKFVAENLHKQMEAFKLPGKIAKKTDRSKIERVFRDRDELPLASNLADPITQALEKSEYLIVICSPRLRASQWCQKEIDTFIQMHGRDKVFAVLIEGEPADSFPFQLLYEEEEVVGEDGTVTKVKRPVEPLAADVRGKNKKEVLKAIKAELLRLLAPMFGLSYDDLKQRHRERRMKKILTASLSAAAVCFAFGAVSTAMALRIQSQKKQIESQNQEIVAQNQEILQKNGEIQAQADEILKKNDTLAKNQALSLAEDAGDLLAIGDRIGAVEKAYSALTQVDGINMPHTAQAQYALTQALYAYNSGSALLPTHQLKAAGSINDLQVSPGGEYAICSDNTYTLYLFEVSTGQLLYSVRNLSLAGSEEYYTFLDDNRVIYLNENNQAEIYNISQQEITRVSMLDGASFFKRSSDGTNLWAVRNQKVMLVDGTTLEVIQTFETASTAYGVRVIDNSRTGNCVAYSETGTDGTFLHLASYENGQVEEKIFDLGDNYITKGMFWQDRFYVNHNASDLRTNSYTAYVLCIDEKSFDKVWECTVEDTVGVFVRPATGPNGRYLLLGTSGEASLIDQTNGQEYCHFALGSTPVDCLSYTSIDSYAVFTRDGGMYAIVPDTKMCYASNLYACCSTNVKSTKNAGGGLLSLPYNSNAIICYFSCNEDQLIPYEGQVPEYDTETSLKYSQAVSFGEEHHFENSAWIDSVVFGEDGICFISYRDQSVVIYDSGKQQELGSFQLTGVSLDRYFGKDQNGVCYVGGFGDGYAINDAYECIACVDNMVGLLPQTNQVILSDDYGGENYLLPIRSVEDLLAMAKELVLR